MERQEYPAMLVTLQPSEAVAVLTQRTKHIHTTNEDIANWLLERKKAEEAYAQALKRLAKKTPPDSSSALGVFGSPWQNFVKSVDNVADAHAQLARRIESDVERPLREFGSSNRQMQQLSTLSGNLQAMAKEYESAQRQSEKARGKAGNKIASANSQLETAVSQWESQAPYVFESLQAADESRWNHLRDVLTQLQTHQIDAAQRKRDASEKCLNALLNVDTADEIKTFSLENTGTGGTSSPSLHRASASQQFERRTSRDPNSSTPDLAPPLIERASNGDNADAASQRSASIHEEKKSKLGGLRRLGTVMGRRKSMMPRSTPTKSKAGNLSAIPDDEPERTQSASGNRLGTTTSRESREPPRTFSGISESLARPQSERRVDSPTPRATNGDAGANPEPKQLQDPIQPVVQQAHAEAADTDFAPPPGPPPGHNSALQDSVLNPTAIAGTQPARSQEPPTLQDPLTSQEPATRQAESNGVQAGGYSIPPSVLDPISLAQQEAAGQSESQLYKMDIRTAPIADENSDAQAAIASVASSLRAQAVPARRSGTTRGRRDVRNTVFVPSAIPEPETTSSTPAQSSPISLAVPGTVSPNVAASPTIISPILQRQLANESAGPTTGDNESIRSGSTTLGSSNKTGIRHPDFHGGATGVNSSIVETSSAWFSSTGTITRAVVIGELALAHNAPDFTTAPQQASVRLENFPTLEKVAPNPGFVQQPSADRPGEYSVDLSVLGGSGRPQVAFKYRVHVADNHLGAHAPLVLAPLWKVEPQQTSLILNYNLNTDFVGLSSGAASITLRDVRLVVHLDAAARPQSCQSRPAGTFVRDQAIFYWKFDELTLVPGQTPEKLLARFATLTQGRGHVEARWELANGGSDLGLSVAEQPPADPFADSSTSVQHWRPITAVRRMVSGTYTTA